MKLCYRKYRHGPQPMLDQIAGPALQRLLERISLKHLALGARWIKASRLFSGMPLEYSQKTRKKHTTSSV